MGIDNTARSFTFPCGDSRRFGSSWCIFHIPTCPFNRLALSDMAIWHALWPSVTGRVWLRTFGRTTKDRVWLTSGLRDSEGPWRARKDWDMAPKRRKGQLIRIQWKTWPTKDHGATASGYEGPQALRSIVKVLHVQVSAHCYHLCPYSAIHVYSQFVVVFPELLYDSWSAPCLRHLYPPFVVLPGC